MLFKTGFGILDVETQKNNWGDGSVYRVNVKISIHIPSFGDEGGYNPPEYASIDIHHTQKEDLKKLIGHLDDALGQMEQVVVKK